MSIPKEFLRDEKIRGVGIIKNLKTDEVYLYSSDDIISSFSKERFKLDLGMHEEKALQEAYTSLGLELFTIELEIEAKRDEDLNSLLEQRKALYIKEGYKLY